MPTYVEIAVNVPQVGEVFDYHLPPELEGRVKLGCLVIAPFGRRPVQGVVLGVKSQPSIAETKAVMDLVDEDPVLTSAQTVLAKALAESTLNSLSACVRLMLPAGIDRQAETLYEIAPGLNQPARLSENQRRLLRLLEARGPLRTRQIENAMRRRNWQAAARSLTRRGILRTRPVLPEVTVAPKTVSVARLLVSPEAAAAAMPDLAEPQRTVQIACSPEEAEAQMDQLARAGTKALLRRQAALRYLLEQTEAVENSQVYAAAGANLADLQKLADLNLVELGTAPSAPLERRQAMLRFLMNEAEPVELSWLYAESGGSRSDIDALAGRGLIVLGEDETWRDPLESIRTPVSEALHLTPDQQKVWSEVQGALKTAAHGRAPSPLLLHGVTGSGKTEIYLRAVAETLRLGRQALVLVPEIALTPQTVRRFLSRFPNRVGLIHSGLSVGERYDTWRRARAGELDVIVGPRSALFTPLPNIGLIVVDESHDDSYYQSEAPYYHARAAAVMYAEITNAVCLLGSATPDITSAYRAARREWHYLRLPARILAHQQAVAEQLESLGAAAEPPQNRAGDAATFDLPPVQIVDMRAELKGGNRSIFSHALQQDLLRVLEAGQQAILFLNRRGTATYVFCRDCGFSLKCPQCDLPLTYHIDRRSDTLDCHHCGYRRKLPQTCPECGGERIRHYGMGTERVEAELQTVFPKARLLRWDASTTRTKGAHEQILKRFAAREADILVGTQMLAKGLDLPFVTLVGVVLADVGLNMPDYRANERAFQVLTQVAGRAGRSMLGGQVIFQTFQPDHYVIQAAAGHDYRRFYERELAYRQQLGYPPFTHMVRIESRDRDERQAEQRLRQLAAEIRVWLAREDRRATQLVGPAPCFFARLAGQYRWQLIVKGPDPVSLLRNRRLDEFRVEVNPVSLL